MPRAAADVSAPCCATAPLTTIIAVLLRLVAAIESRVAPLYRTGMKR
jgi:hypothetical protein